jgi:hypothetical protein
VDGNFKVKTNTYILYVDNSFSILSAVVAKRKMQHSTCCVILYYFPTSTLHCTYLPTYLPTYPSSEIIIDLI